MKTKYLCLATAIVFVISMSIVVFAEHCASKSAKTACYEKETVQIAKTLKEGEIPLDKIPKNIKKIAKKTVKGIKITEAEIDGGNYELEGNVGKDEYEIEISPNGKIIKVEVDEDDDDDCEIEVGNDNPGKIDSKDDDPCVIENKEKKPVINSKDDDPCVIESESDSPLSDAVK